MMESIAMQRRQTATTGGGALAALAELCDCKEYGNPPSLSHGRPPMNSKLVFPKLFNSNTRPSIIRVVAPRFPGATLTEPTPVSPLRNSLLNQQRNMVGDVLSASLSLAELSQSPVVFRGDGSILAEKAPSASSSDSVSSKSATSSTSIKPRTKQTRCLSKPVVGTEATATPPTQGNGNVRFRQYQVTTWSQRLEEVQAFVRQHGHCMIPSDYPPNQKLAKWAKRQRCQYQLFQSNPTKSSMTAERIRVLEDFGFCWQNKMSVWQSRYEELLQFHLQFGHTQVPSSYKPNQRLATWVKCQRRQKRLRDRGKPSSMTGDRIALLDSVNFVWRMYPSNPRDE
ncbi:unnamed protein product [Cylindrotheca closterium]|uniref:Helicase-associated domain-containing protein n=1 Tax=Cylindrotheca closterium TaxID=2856 RepID=A0AAD2JNV3_9STRA|nr:unnamed protein product [Cylindrotheca closterium]